MTNKVIFKVRAPDGSILSIEGDEGSPPAEIAAFAASQHSRGVDMRALVDTAKDVPQYAMDAVKGVGTGVMDAAVGAGQIVSKLGTQSFSDRYADYMRQREAQIQTDRGTMAGKFDPARMTGNALTLMAGGAGPASATIGGRILTGAKIGGVGGLVSPATPDATGGDFAIEKGIQTGIGAGAGALAVPVIEGLIKGFGAAVNSLVPRFKGSFGPGQSAIEATIKTELSKNGVKWDDLAKGYRASVVSQVHDSLRAGEKLDFEAIARMADFNKIGVTPLKGQISRDPVQFAAEQNLARREVGRPIAERLGEQNTGFIGTLDNARPLAGADKYAAGQRAIEGLAAKDAPRKEAVDAAYKAFRSSAGLESEVPLQPIAQRVGNIIEDMGDDKIPGVVMSRLKDFGLFEGKQTRVFNIREAEKLKSFLGENAGARGSSQEKAMTMLRNSVDEAILGAGDAAGAETASAASQARKLAAQRFGAFERSPALENVVSKATETAPPEQFVEKFFVRSPVQDVANNLRNMTPESRAAVRAGVFDWLKGKAVPGSGDAAKFSQDAFNRALNSIGDRRLDLIFAGDRQSLEVLKALGRASAAAQSAPVGAGVNYSNSGNVILDFLDKMANFPLLSAVMGKPSAALSGGAVSGALLNPGITQAPASVIRPALMDAATGRLGATAPALMPGMLEQFYTRRQQQ